ncbi:Casein kinase II subunit alpha [Histomonas meleagridis]|uniref:Casein kinase II subunit alpha n=1 Tax=Histomonas meleagridis TaxID=135588 RepID=UPI00355AAE18|nr:Casein kinase II subunit alpha [Histomonas meleagridis]KAH0803759.1 Casein kinase II subunit alpha [Histomonas meleagridis]
MKPFNQTRSHPITHYKINTISSVYTYFNQFLIPDPVKEIEKYEIKYGDIEKYRIISPIGCGKYSLVFVGQSDKGLCAIKVLKEVSYDKVKREFFILNRIRSLTPNVLQYRDAIVDSLTRTLSIVTDYVQFDSPDKLYPSFTIEDVRYYMFLLLHTLDRCHSVGVMHRDIKPGNVLIHHKQQKLTLIDWGLSELYYPYKQYTVRVSTMRYKAPELLIGYHFYDYGIDVWSAGCVMAEMLFEIGFITGTNYIEVLQSIGNIFGKDQILQYIDKLGVELTDCYINAINNCEERGFEKRIALMKPYMRNADALDLLQKLMCIDHTERITARDALRHPFFASLIS